ncbi:MAG: response regulator [Elusimicrobia bacterium]|nr:response regulator [Elusimicrobiota bacterium]
MNEKRVLIIDDDTHTNDLVAETLRLEGFIPVQVHSGEEALEYLSKEAVDLILLDLILPGIKGWAVAEEIRKNPRISNIPILIISILYPEDTELQKQHQSIFGYVCKPFDLNVLVQEVHKTTRK